MGGHLQVNTGCIEDFRTSPAPLTSRAELWASALIFRLYMNAARCDGAAALVVVKSAPVLQFVARFDVPPAQHEGPCTA